jgi:hypothetical protein
LSPVHQENTRDHGKSTSRSLPVKAKSCSATLGHEAQAFMAANRPCPRVARDGKSAHILWHQLKDYSNSDPSKAPQKAIPINLLKFLYDSSITHVEKASAELLLGTLFLAMQSCEYSTISGKRKTKLLTINNLYFYKNNKQLHLHDKFLHNADYMKITFKFQKTGLKN